MRCSCVALWIGVSFCVSGLFLVAQIIYRQGLFVACVVLDNAVGVRSHVRVMRPSDITHVYGLTEVYGPATVCAWHEEWNHLPMAEQARLQSRQGVRSVAM